MSNKRKENMLIRNTLLDEGDSAFKEIKSKSKESNQKKDKKMNLMKPKLVKRKEITKMEHIFYIVLFITALVSVGLAVYYVDLFGTFSSIIAGSIIFIGYKYTEPYKLRAEYRNITFWNASVTLSVLLKSVHPIILQWKNVWIWSFSILSIACLFFNPELSAVLWCLFLFTGILCLADRKFRSFSEVSLVLSRCYGVYLIWMLILGHVMPLSMSIMALVTFQIYERTRLLNITYPSGESEIM